MPPQRRGTSKAHPMKPPLLTPCIFKFILLSLRPPRESYTAASVWPFPTNGPPNSRRHQTERRRHYCRLVTVLHQAGTNFAGRGLATAGADSFDCASVRGCSASCRSYSHINSHSHWSTPASTLVPSPSLTPVPAPCPTLATAAARSQPKSQSQAQPWFGTAEATPTVPAPALT